MKSKFLKNMGRGFLPVVGVALPFLFAGTTPAAELKALTSSLPAVISQFQLQPLTAMTNSTQLHLAISLPLQNQDVLNGLLSQMYDPASPSYHHYLTPQQFAQNFGASQQDYQAVINFARSNNLTVTTTYSNRLVVDVSGSVADIQKAFNVSLGVYQDPQQSRTFYAPNAVPTVSSGLNILKVSGLDNYYIPRPHSVIHPLNTSSVMPNAGSGPGGTFMGSDFRNAYAPKSALKGAGQNVALVQFDAYFDSDITAYANQIGLDALPQLVPVPVNGGLTAPVSVNGNGEVSLDIEMILAMAPGVGTIYVYEAPNPSPWESMLSQIADDDLAQQVGCSWGGGGPNAAAEQIFLQMMAQGQSFYNASGDDDAFTNVIPFPSDSVNITQVGGTTLTTANDGSYASEKVWNWGGGTGSSGGISPTYSIPSWQSGIDMTASQGSTTMRNTPDVAMTGDNVFVCYNHGSQGAFGGTSCAAPLWAGFTALVNEEAANNGQPAAGFINPAIYNLASGPDYTVDFNDVITGNNTWSGSPNLFFAVTGYDLCTGLGTPGPNLITALSGLPPRNGFLTLSVSPVSDSVLLNSSTQTVFVTVNDVYGVTNATVTAYLGDGTPVTFSNDGASPDAVSGDSIYTGSIVVPASGSSLTLTVVASATNEIGVTNVLNYFLAPLPLNDNFANATKVPAAGATYLSNNHFATIETNEPVRNVAASLWWSWTPSTTANVLINTIGSKINNVLAVYTGNVLTTNMTVVAATNNLPTSSKPAQLSFTAQAGTTYKIAVSSKIAGLAGTGTVGLHIVPGGYPDTNAPTVSVSSPLSGLTVTNRLLTVTGTASDSGANASGLSQVTVSVNGVKTVATGQTSWSALVGLQSGINLINVSVIDFAGNVYTLPTTIQVDYLVPTPANDFFATATALTGTSGTIIANNETATKEIGEPDHAGNPGGASLWWSFVPPADGVLTLNTTGSTFDTLLGLYTGTTVSQLTTIASDDDAYDGVPGGASLIEQAVKAGKTYYVAVDGYDAAVGTVSLAYSFVPGAIHLITVTNAAGGTVEITMTNSLGGTAQFPALAGYVADGSAVTLTAIPNLNSQFDIWGGNVVSLANPLTVIAATDLNLAATFDATIPSDGFESGNLTRLTWTTAGNAAWFVQTNVVDQGLYAARSGNITNSQTSSLTLTTNFFSGTGSFNYRISTEAVWDKLTFYVDGVLAQQWSGEVPWSYYGFPISAGMHTLTWTYAKDPSGAAGLDAVFIDNVSLPVSPAKNSSTAAQLQLKRQTDGQFYINLQGQANQLYIVQGSTNLIDWSNISTNVASGSVVNLPLPVNGTDAPQFYRAVVP